MRFEPPARPGSEAEPSEHRRPLVVAEDLPRTEPGHVEIRVHVPQEGADLVEPAIHPEPRESRVQLAGEGRRSKPIHRHERPVDDVDDVRMEVAPRCCNAITAAHCVEVGLRE